MIFPRWGASPLPNTSQPNSKSKFSKVTKHKFGVQERVFGGLRGDFPGCAHPLTIPCTLAFGPYGSCGAKTADSKLRIVVALRRRLDDLLGQSDLRLPMTYETGYHLKKRHRCNVVVVKKINEGKKRNGRENHTLFVRPLKPLLLCTESLFGKCCSSM